MVRRRPRPQAASKESPISTASGTPAGWAEWRALGAELSTPAGVHAPSPFSALLASSMGDCAGRTVVDAGSGAGLISIAALAAGAAEVLAIDLDPAAIEASRENVRRVLGAEDYARFSTRILDFSELGAVAGDLLAANPPQRPTEILAGVESDQRHLHEGGGSHGLDTIRLLLRYARTSVVRTTAAGVLDIDAARHDLPQWDRPVRVTEEILPMHRSWRPLTGPSAAVGVWDFASVR